MVLLQAAITGNADKGGFTMMHPLESIPRGTKLPTFIWLLVATFWLSVVFRFIGPASPNIVDFEFCHTVDRANAILNSWNQVARVQAAFSLGFDYLYIPVYSTTIALACVWAANLLGTNRIWHNMGMLFAWGIWVAAILDCVENYALLTMLQGPVVNPYPAIASLCASGKFSLILLGLVFCIIVSLIRIISNPGHSKKTRAH
jgi:hypothetical protein